MMLGVFDGETWKGERRGRDEESEDVLWVLS